jgi:hypothetical protein
MSWGHDIYGRGGYKEMYYKKFTYIVMYLMINHKRNQISTPACIYSVCITTKSRDAQMYKCS